MCGCVSFDQWVYHLFVGVSSVVEGSSDVVGVCL